MLYGPGVLLALGNRTYDITHRALVMGILNRTPDSFFDAGGYWDFDAFLAKADDLVGAGADLLDIGGVKAGPGEEVTEQEELDRVVPAIEELAARFDLPLSIDTWRASVLDECLSAGAVIANDISGFADPDYLTVASKHRASVVATHIRLGPRVADPTPHYDDLVGEVCAFLTERAKRAEAAGIAAERIMLDAGLDLGKTEPMSLKLLAASSTLVALGWPLLLSASNKRFLGELFDAAIDDRHDLTVSAHAIGIERGCRVLRAHDVRAARRTVEIAEAVLAAADE